MRSNLASSALVLRGVEPAAEALCAQMRHAKLAPDIAVAFARWDGAAWQAVAGGSRAFFDLASLTKSFVAASVVTQGLPLSTPVSALLPALAGTYAGGVTLEDMLSHRSGLRAHAHLWLCASRAEALHHSGNLTQRGWDGVAAVYSDLGYILAGEMLAVHAGKPLAEVVQRHVCVPLGLGVASAASLTTEVEVAPTEFMPGRGGLLRGVVHDDNAWFLSGKGVSGHAGLFGTARDVLTFATAMADAQAGRGPWASLVEPLLRARLGGAMRAGFDGKRGADSLAGRLCSDATFGHLGFTGTSYWVDPLAGIATVLLTNRVSPSSAHPEGIRSWRPRAHDVLWEMANGLG